MSIAVTTPTWEMALESRTVRQFLRAIGVAVITLAAGCGVYCLERFGFAIESRTVQNPADVMVRVLGMAHFAVGWLYLITSPRLRNRPALARLLVATLIGIVLCLFFAQFGGTRHPLLAMVFYGYFLIHELGDETMFYQAYGDHASRSPAEAAFLRSLTWATAIVLLTVLAGFYFGFAWVENHKALHRIPAGVAPAGLAALGAAALTMLVRATRRGVSLYGSCRGIIETHRPLLMVYAGLLAVLVAGSVLGTTGLNLLILIHASVWIVFTRFQLAQRRARPRGNPWTWLRGTPAGFLTLHIGAAALFLALMAVRVYVWRRQGWISEILTSHNFCYWGLMHISMSLWNAK